MIFCKKLGREAEPLPRAPYPGALGQRIFSEISQEAWQQWLARQTLLINEYRLDPLQKETRAFLEKEMRQFLFEE